MGEHREENMAGPTTDASRFPAASAVAVAVALLGIVAGWLVYLACSRWPVLSERLPPLGFLSLGVALHMVLKLRRSGRETP